MNDESIRVKKVTFTRASFPAISGGSVIFSGKLTIFGDVIPVYIYKWLISQCTTLTFYNS